MSVRQADRVSALLQERGDAWNTPWSGAAALVRPGMPPWELAGGLRITLLSPDESGLEKLRRTWAKEMDRLGLSGRKRGTSRTRAKAQEFESEPDEVGGAPVFLSYAHEDRRWVDQITQGLDRLEPSVDLFVAERLAGAEEWETRILDQIDRASAAVVLLSDAYLRSKWCRREMEALARRAATGTRVIPVFVNAVDTSGTGLEGFQSANPHGRPLEVLDPKEQAELIRRIGEALALEPSRPPRRSERRTAGRPNVERLAEEPFEPDTAVANGASLAFLAEIGSTALLVGGDAHARTLVRSIRALLEERGLDRLPLGAFVVPHGGSRRNLSRELLELLACDKYLFSNNGAKFRLPDRETVARILAYGRASADVPLTLVFNYRTPETDIWDDKDLQQRYGYRAVYPEPGTEGIRVEL